MELYVGNLPWSVTDQSLTALFAAHATVDRVKVVMDRETGRSRGFAFVTINDEAGATAAINALNGKDLEGRAVTVRKAEPKPPRQEGAGGGYGGGGGGGGGGYGGGGRR
ncbi:MAG: RNA-binding protein [Planctomycetota bacterium]